MRVPFVLAISEHESSRHGAALTSDMRKWFAGSAFLFRKLETTVNITTSWFHLADTFGRSRLQLEMTFTNKRAVTVWRANAKSEDKPSISQTLDHRSL